MILIEVSTVPMLQTASKSNEPISLAWKETVKVEKDLDITTSTKNEDK